MSHMSHMSHMSQSANSLRAFVAAPGRGGWKDVEGDVEEIEERRGSSVSGSGSMPWRRDGRAVVGELDPGHVPERFVQVPVLEPEKDTQTEGFTIGLFRVIFSRFVFRVRRNSKNQYP